MAEKARFLTFRVLKSEKVPFCTVLSLLLSLHTDRMHSR